MEPEAERTFIDRFMHPVQVFLQKTDPVAILDNSFFIAESLFIMHTHSRLRNEPFQRRIPLFENHRDIVNTFWINFPSFGSLDLEALIRLCGHS